MQRSEIWWTLHEVYSITRVNGDGIYNSNCPKRKQSLFHSTKGSDKRGSLGPCDVSKHALRPLIISGYLVYRDEWGQKNVEHKKF